MEALRKDEHYTYADYCQWDDDARYELIDGESYLMSPSPLRRHQRISGELFRQLSTFLHGKPCEVYAAPFDVRLNADTYDNTVVQPDIVVVCDRSKLIDTGCAGAPDMVVEILSYSTAARDRVLKLNLYQSAGVREYWIVDPESRTVSVQILTGEGYITRGYTDADAAPVHVLDGCVINLPDVFAE